MYADLHLHSVCSDGTWSPEELATACLHADIGYAALTDHNEYKGTDAFMKTCKENGIKAIRGCEISANFEAVHVHILAYNFKPNQALDDLLAKCRFLMLQMSYDLIQKLENQYYTLSAKEYKQRELDFDHREGGWAGLHYLREKGVIEKLTDGFHLYKDSGLDYCTYPFPSVEEVCKIIHECGGTAILAHPGNYYNDVSDSEYLRELKKLKDLGLDGIECYYPSNSINVHLTSLYFCNRNPGFKITAGSDCHGTFNRVVGDVVYDLAATKTPMEYIRL